MLSSIRATRWLRVLADASVSATHWLQEVRREMPVVNREVVLPVPRERAWELVTEPAELETWLADEVDFEAEEGAPLRIDDREGVVEHVEAEERIVFSWGDSIVEWRLEDHPRGTRFVVTEHRIAGERVVWGLRLQALAHATALCPA